MTPKPLKAGGSASRKAQGRLILEGRGRFGARPDRKGPMKGNLLRSPRPRSLRFSKVLETFPWQSVP